MILIIIILYHQALSLVIREQHANKNGLSGFKYDLKDYPQQVTLSSKLIVSVYLNISSKNPGYLAYCTNEFLKESSSIFQNSENLESYILTQQWQPNYHKNSTENQCVFDSQASIYRASSHSLTLIYENGHPFLKQSSQRLNWITLSESSFTIYVYSELPIDYELLILFDEDLECENQCNQNGICQASLIGTQVCKCREEYIDNLCSYSAPSLEVDQKIKVQMKDNGKQYFQLKLTQFKPPSFKLNLQVNDAVQLYYGCSSKFPQQVFDHEPLVMQDQYTFIINSTKLDDCIDYTNQLNEKYKVSISPSYLIIVENKSKENRIIYLELKEDSQEESNLGMIIIIVTTVLGSTIGLAFGMYIYRRCQKKKTQEITEKQVIKAKYATYSEVLQVYPGLQEIQQCSICLSKFDQENEISVTLCLHIFHRFCLHSWLKQQKKCPFCREYVNFTQIKNMQQFEQHLQLLTQEKSEHNLRLQRWKKLQDVQQQTG